MAKVDFKKAAGSIMKGISVGGEYAVDKAKDAAALTKQAVNVSQQAIVNALDQDGNGQIDSVDIILMALKVPGVKINRSEFLTKEFFKNHPQEVVHKAIATTPAQAGISSEEIDKIADEVIKFERNAVSGISVALGVPGGAAMAATIPTDIAQYYGYMIRTAQKLLYLYGFPELDTSEESIMLDSETINCLTVCLGIMYGVANANNAIKAMAKALATGVEKKLMKAALTKGAIYPIVKSVAKWFSVTMTKEIFAGFFKKAIPVVGGVIGGGLTFATFKPCCYRLKDALSDTMLSNPEHESNEEENEIYQNIKDAVIDVDFTDDAGSEPPSSKKKTSSTFNGFHIKKERTLKKVSPDSAIESVDSRILEVIKGYDIQPAELDLYNTDIIVKDIDDTDSNRQYVLSINNIPVNALYNLKRPDTKAYEVYCALPNEADDLVRIRFDDDLYVDLPEDQDDPDYFGPSFKVGDSLRVSNSEWRVDLPDSELIRARLEISSSYNPFLVNPILKDRGYYDLGNIFQLPSVYEYGFTLNSPVPAPINGVNAENTKLILKCILRCIVEKDSYRIITPWDIPKITNGKMTLTFKNGETRTYSGFYTFAGAKFDTLKLFQDVYCAQRRINKDIL